MIHRFPITIIALSTPLAAITVDEKRQQLTVGSPKIEVGLDDHLQQVNLDYSELKSKLAEQTARAWDLQKKNASREEFLPVLSEIRETRQKMNEVSDEWRKRASSQNAVEAYGLWNQPDISIEQLVSDYGSLDHVYLIPKEIAEMSISMSSNLPIPRENWTEMLSLVLSESGIGIHQPNPYLRVLFLLKSDEGRIAYITDRRTDLELLSSETRVAFILRPDAPEAARVYQILSRLSGDPQTILHNIGGQLIVVGAVPTVQELLKVYDFLQHQDGQRQFRMLSLRRGNPEEMAALLNVVFSQPEKGLGKTDQASPIIQEGLIVFPLKHLAQTLFVVGTPAQIRRAEQILEDLQEQLSETQAKHVFWYTCKHSNPEDLAEVLNKVYEILKAEKIEGMMTNSDQAPVTQQAPPPPETPPPADMPKEPSVYDHSNNIVVRPAGVNPARDTAQDSLSKRDNFIVDKKTGSIIMVLDPVSLERIQDLLKKLDVPKTMVRIDVLLFEKKINDTTNYGLNMMKLGDSASKVNTTGATWNDTALPLGIFSFLMSRTKSGGMPAFDLAYNFLLSQSDVMINANPSVTTINQTTTTIKLVEERSISEGRQIQNVDGENINTETFVRAQYGIIIELTPTVHLAGKLEDDDGFDDYVTLETNVTFDTVSPDLEDRPVVTRRNVVNQVLVPDGETIILGGLRNKETRDVKRSVPFFGEIPLVGKLFSDTTIRDDTTEMFMMLTPKIIVDPQLENKRFERMELTKRPGDMPEFIHKLRKAEECERRRVFMHSVTMLLGPQTPKTRPMETYDGR